MASDFNHPTVTTPGASVMGYILDNIKALAKQTIGSSSNIPDASMRINPANGLIQTYLQSSTTWQGLQYAGASTGAANVYSFTIGQGVTMAAGQQGRFVAHQENTGSCTGTITSGTTSLGSFTFKKRVGNALYDLCQGDVPNGHRVQWECDGTYLIVLNPANPLIVDRTVAAVDVVSTGTETTVWSATLKANTTDIARGVKTFFLGDLKNNSGSANVLDIRFKLGSETAATFSVSIANAVNRGSFVVEWHIVPSGVTNAQRHEFKIFVNNNTIDNTGGAFVSLLTTYIALGSTSQDLTADKTMLISADWTTGDANRSFRQRGVYTQLM